MLNQEEVDKEEEKLREDINKLSEDKRIRFYFEVKQEIKDPDTYAVLNWFFITGLHHFYLGKWINGLVNLVSFIIGIVFISMGENKIGFGLIIFVSIIELWALFRSQIIIQDWNNKIYERILTGIKEVEK